MKSDGSFEFKSGYIKNGGPVLRNSYKFWKFMEAYNRDGFNFIQFSRKITVCGEMDNYIDIIGGSALTMYGYGMNQQLEVNNLENQFNQMARKYFMAIPLVATANVINDLAQYKDLETYDFVSNVKF